MQGQLHRPPDRRRTVYVWLRDIPLEQRFSAALEACKDARDTREKYQILGLAVDPGDVGAWIRP